MYKLKRIFQIDYKRMFNTIRKIAKRSKKSFIRILFDVIHCGLKYGAGYMDYFVFNFEDLTEAQRATYITRSVNNAYFLKMNNREFYHYFNEKPDFLKRFKNYINRDYVDLKECSYEEYEQFVKKHPVFMAKPADGQCGKGIEIVDSNGRNLKEVYDEVKEKNLLLLEEKIVQNKDISSIYPLSINTIRIVTCYKNGNANILFKAMRIGNEGRHVDNFNSGGMFTVIDDDGVIKKPALDKEGNIYYKHPYTGTDIVGFRIPMFNEIIEECKKLASEIPEVGLVGWDMCVTEKGIDVVEGNQLPGYDIYQSRPHLNEDRIGLKPRFDSVIYSEN